MATAFQPITFTKTDARGEHVQVAETPADEVRLRFDGWRVKADAKTTKNSAKPASQNPGPAAG